MSPGSRGSATPPLLTPEQIAEASRVIAAAFANDPAWVYVVPDARKRSRILTWAGALDLRLALPFDATFATPGEPIDGVAAFYPPGCYPPPLLRQAWLGRALPLRLSPSSILRALRILVMTERAHPRTPHWYLQTLAVAPERQRQGVGSCLITSVLDQADEERLDVYLETTNEANINYYARFGFEVERVLSSSSGPPPVWTMLRRAR